MNDFYLIKFRNGIPFILGQYDTEEEAVEAKYREGVDSKLMIAVDLDKLKSIEADRDYYQNMCNEISKKVSMIVSLYKTVSTIESVIKNYGYHHLIR